MQDSSIGDQQDALIADFSPPDEQRAEQALIAAAARLLRNGARNVPEDFVACLFSHAVPEDLMHYDPRQLAGLAADAWALLAVREPGTPSIRIEMLAAMDGLAREHDYCVLEIEMSATAVSSQNRCVYGLTAHGNAVRQLGDPVLGEMMVMNYRVARLSKRHRAMLDFATKLTERPWEIEEEDRERLRRAGFNDRDIWDIASVAAFYNMNNRLASATDMRPNSQYHGQAR